MKKVFVLLALLSAASPLVAAENRAVYYAGYRIGDSNVMSDSVRILEIDADGNEKELQSGVVTDASQDLGLSLVASRINGQKIVRWWSYNEESSTPPEYNGVVTNATDTYTFNWEYGSVDYKWACIVVDYDYIKYKLSYDANGGSGAPSAVNNIIYTNEVVIASGNGLSRNGYTWSGWTNNLTTTVWTGGEIVTGSDLGLNSIVDGSNVVLRAKWTPNIYTVTLNPCEGTVDPGSVSVTYDAAWPALPTPTRDGYRFVGWFTAALGGTEVNTNSAYATAANTTNYAHWAELVTATFKDGHTGEILKTEMLDKGGTPTPPEAPEHVGYYPKGWAPPVSPISVNTTFTMEYAQYTYTVVFHADNGTEAVQTQQFTYNASEEPLNSVASMGFSRTGYNFQNWTNSVGTVYGDGQKVSNLAQSGEYHLYAAWTPITYTISFYGNGADSGSVGDIAATYDVEYPLPVNGFVRAGRTFKAWRLGLDGDAYNVGESVSNLTTTADATVTFYAVWSEPRYIAFDGNGANDAPAMAEDVMTFEGVETKTLIPNKFEKTGYTFVGWATNEATAAALAIAYTNCAEVVSTNLWMAIGETNVLYAAWQANRYTVVFDRNGGTGSMGNQVFYYDQAQELSECKFTSNLEFQGWATSQSGDKVFDDKATVSNLTAEVDGIVTLYAVWDNGDLSKAMHCDNLFWESTHNPGHPQWEIAEGAGEGYNLSGSSVSNQVGYSQQSQTLRPIASSGAGKLSFMYKMAGDSNHSWLTFKSSDTGDNGIRVAWSADWNGYGPIDVGDISTVQIFFNGNEDVDPASTVWIDQMTWIPAGQEPTDEDRPTISGLTRTTDGFALSVDQTNISDNFSYQILATNELANGDWPVKETLTADELKAGYSIAIEENEPKMFYKVKVISK